MEVVRAVVVVPAAALQLLLLLLLAALPGSPALCPAPAFKTVTAECRWVMGRLVPCTAPIMPGTRASFSCKPQYRLPATVVGRAMAETSVCREDGSWAPQPFTCVPECGRVVGKGEPLIVDGKAVTSAVEFPWHVAVYDRKHSGGVYQSCGGTLVTPKFFVSAAHCFAAAAPSHSKKGVVMRPAADFAAAVGKLHRDWAADEHSTQKRDVLKIHTDGYGGPRLNHVRDLALVEMASAVELNAVTLPACVDWSLQAPHLRDGDVGAVIGWGGLWRTAATAPASESLQSAALPFVSKEQCLQTVPAQLVQYILLSDDRFCAGVVNGTTVAHGDSGGGLAFRSAEEGKWFLRGVVSVGMPATRTLTAFTNVSSFVRWMADRIQDEEIRAAAAEHQVPLEIPKEYTASDLEEEQRVAYFREDLGLSLHHLHWHHVYSYMGPPEVVARDRRGELLFYMHGQLLARYNVERLSNQLPRAKRLALREPIKEGYYPKLDNLVASRVWPGRPPNTRLQDLSRDGMKINIEDLERWTGRVYEAIAVGSVVNSTGGLIKLTAENGADILGNMVESSSLSPNRQLYGEILNQGHILISLAHDPENRFLESFGVMGDSATALRDPVFYRWHTNIQEIVRQFKQTLPSYTEQELAFPDVVVTKVTVQRDEQASGVLGNGGSGRPNEIHTHWQSSDLELSRGLDFSPRPPVFARLAHLQHEPFTYSIQVENKGNAPKEGYVRIFLAPTHDERGQPMQLDEMRLFTIEMDKFVAKLEPGPNTIRRRSSESSLTIPFARTFRNLDRHRPLGGRALREFLFCGCGLPQHLLVPRGTTDGQPFHLLVVVSDYERDRVDQVVEGSCRSAPSLCGEFAGRYPDRRAMGFPFDRRPAVDSLRAFLTPNMLARTVKVRFRDAVTMAARNATVFGTRDSVIKLPVPQGASLSRFQPAALQQQGKHRQPLPLPVIVMA